MTGGGHSSEGVPIGSPHEPPSGGRRRLWSAAFLAFCLLAGLAPHGLPAGLRLVPSLMLATLLGGYSVRTVLRTSRTEATATAPLATVPPLVEVVVAARDEEAVIRRLVERVAALRYPSDQLRLWVIDDGSIDRTPALLDALATELPLLQVLHRPRDAGGGKSGALNLVLSQLEGPWMLVLDADADLQPDVLERLIPFAESGGWSAVQLRKAVVNADTNLLTQAQAMEMAFDALLQEGRLAGGGVAELRGNGQLLRVEAVRRCGGFHEGTVTDDLDLSLRLLLARQPIGLLWDPPVQEEAVESLAALWRQRQRWAEGGLQRFFDYAPGLVQAPIGLVRRLDLLAFFVLQYVLPVLAVADLIGALLSRTPPCSWPFSVVALGLSGLAIARGCQRPSEGPALPPASPPMLLLGIVYLIHWFVVIPWVVVRMTLLPKRLVWAKTTHLGGADDSEASSEAGIGDDDGELAAEVG
ncbi:MAG: glycosyltransferase [Cyanobacteriota bacterium]|nr:glycosyltransferase [Cyanobacteriota bacterium]